VQRMLTKVKLETRLIEFDSWVKDSLFKREHKAGTEILEQAVDIHLINLYLELNLHELLADNSEPMVLSDKLGFSDSSWIALLAILNRLADRYDFINCIEDPTVSGIESNRFEAVTKPEDRSKELPGLYVAMKALGNDYIAPLEFLEFGRTHFVRSLRDDHEFMDRVLTGQEKEFNETWDRATNTDPLQDIHGIMGAKAVDMLFEGGTILEVGGGTGNGMRNNLDAFQDRYSHIQCDWRLLNINKDWAAQRLEANSVDMVYGVNAAHIAMHTVDFLNECKRVLKPGGCVVFSERLRRFEGDMAPREIVLNLATYHRTAAIRHPEYRPAHAYLSGDNWIRACELAEFSDVSIWPGAESSNEYFPDQYAAVIVARV